ncbi:unnamed protein product, partial [marine sediment metagenome]
MYLFVYTMRLLGACDPRPSRLVRYVTRQNENCWLLAALFAMPFRTLLPIFVVDLFNRGPEALGLLTSIMGGGAILGSLGIASLGAHRRGLMLICGGVLSGIAL